MRYFQLQTDTDATQRLGMFFAVAPFPRVTGGEWNSTARPVEVPLPSLGALEQLPPPAVSTYV